MKVRMFSRKFLMSLVVFGTATVLLCVGVIDSSTWSLVSCSTFGGYIAGNVVDMKISKGKEEVIDEET